MTIRNRLLAAASLHTLALAAPADGAGSAAATPSLQDKVVALIAGADINPTVRAQLVADVLKIKDDAVATVQADAPSIEADAGAAVETVAQVAITHAVGPFVGGIIWPAAKMLLDKCGGSVATAASHLLAAAEQWGHKSPTAVVTTTPPANAAGINPGTPAIPVQPTATVADATAALSSPQ